jgi:stress-induced morphogen
MSDAITRSLEAAIVTAIPDARVVVVSGSPGHYSLAVTSAAFVGQSLLGKQRLVYAAIKDLMAGDAAPVHAIDRLETKLP